MDEYDLVERMAKGVRNDLFWYGLIAGCAGFLLSLLALLGDSQREFWHDLPWFIVFSLLVGVFGGGLMTRLAIREQLRRIAKDKQCDFSLTIRFDHLI
jgi:MFS family permease